MGPAAARARSHCQFSDVERERAFLYLAAWVEQGQKPAGDDFSNADLRNIGLAFTDPLLPGDPGGG